MMNFAIFSACFATVVLPPQPTPVERTAAAELTSALERIGGAPAAWTYHVGATDASRAAFGATPDWADDEIGLKTVDGALVLDGHATRGVLYAVYTYLEDTLGVRWWTSTETDWPTNPPAALPALDIRYAPSIKYRETYYQDGFDATFKAHLKGNFSSRTRYMFKDLARIPSDKGGDSTLLYYAGRGSSYHAFFEVLPPARHFKDHPDWYSLIGGKRRGDRKSQLCLTNREMEAAYIAELRRLLRANPDVDFVQVSQNDSRGACECAACRAVEAEEGGAHAAPLLRFVNRVAEALEPEFPRMMFDTFAYQYTRKPPTKTRPRHNVTVRLCDIECDFRRPLAELPANASFVADLEGWKKVAPGQLYIWDYVTDFTSYMLPHPNYRSLAANVRLFASAGAVGVFEQGDALCTAGEFWPLRQWLLGHLLWKPSADAAALQRDFLTGYYGPSAAPILQRYLDFLCDAAARCPRAIGCYHANVDAFLSVDEMRTALALMDAALAAAEKDGPVFARRVRREKLSTDHVRLLNWTALGETGDYAAAVERWFADGDAFGVLAVHETTDRGARAAYRTRLLGKGPAR